MRSPYSSILGLWYAFVDAGGVLICVVLGRRPGRCSRPLLLGVGRINPLLSARHSKDPDLPVEGFTWVTCGSVSTSVASDWCHHWLQALRCLEGSFETGQEGGLLLLCAPTPNGDRRTIALPRPVASVTILAASLLSAWALSGVSPQLPMSRFCPPQHRSMLRVPRDRVQECSVAQPEEGLDAAPWNCLVEQIMIVR
ncbi:hypothetical protein GL50803_0031391 [Giardia duodenalis]|uniref:Uncharacterized protein n=1 Tax=Giardia intestinalis (strain ATCC 50803 / WB clone C6) TaxID=184922 RepID=D3KHD3_GIAIC|nr:hypothetical protein GL50803_0031391 [Giardia intestinalis]KAE8304908.1 hypothetical protein GL50803_0031391 [Giardia intestinalis]